MPIEISHKFLILSLFLIKFVFFLMCRWSKLIEIFKSYAIIINWAMVISWILSLSYLIIVRVVLGWYLIWPMSIYLLSFFASIVFDAYYFGLMSTGVRIYIFQKGLSRKIEQLVKSNYFSYCFRLIKKTYFIAYFAFYAFLFFCWDFPGSPPSIDSFQYVRYLDRNCSNDKKEPFYYKWKFYYLLEKYSIGDGRLIVSIDGGGDKIFSERKFYIFRKQILAFPELTDICYYVNSKPVTLDWEEFIDDEKLRRNALSRRLKYLKDRQKINFEILKMHGYFLSDYKDGTQQRYTRSDIESLDKLYNPNNINHQECLRIKMNNSTIEIENHCEAIINGKLIDQTTHIYTIKT